MGVPTIDDLFLLVLLLIPICFIIFVFLSRRRHAIRQSQKERDVHAYMLRRIEEANSAPSPHHASDGRPPVDGDRRQGVAVNRAGTGVTRAVEEGQEQPPTYQAARQDANLPAAPEAGYPPLEPPPPAVIRGSAPSPPAYE